MYKEFYEISIWQDGANLLEKIYIISNSFPLDEKYFLISQLRRSANAIIANIAGSHGRYYYKDKIRILYIARGELEEVRSHLLIASNLNFITVNEYSKLENAYLKLKKDINSYIMDLNKKSNFQS